MLRHMELLALQGFTVGITATRRWEDQANLLSARGATILHGPVLDVDVIGADAALRDVTAELIAHPPDLTILCTGAGTKAWFAAAETFGAGDALAAALGQGGPILPRGPKTVAAAVEVGLDVPRQGARELLRDVLEVAAQTVSLTDARVAVQLDGGEGTWLQDRLTQAGAKVIPVRAYRWSARDDESAAMRLLDAACTRRLDAVTFTSTPAVEGLFTLAERTALTAALRHAFATTMAAVSVGPVTTTTLRAHGVEQPIEPVRARLGAMVGAVIEHLECQRHVVDLAGHRVVLQGLAAAIDDRIITLSSQERRLLATLAEQPGRVVSKAALAALAAPDDPSGEHAIEMAIGRLRRKLGPAGAGIATVFRRGYRLEGTDHAAGVTPTAS